MDIATPPHSPARAALRLEYVTILFAALEAVAALTSGIVAGSVVLVAFGADSVIEMLSALVVLGQLLALVHERPIGRFSEHRSHRVLAVFFFILALYVTLSALAALVREHHPHENALGFAVAVVSCVVMPLLAYVKRRSAQHLGEHGLRSLARLMGADAVETALCAVLAFSTLIGVALASLHWWWADPVASLAVVYFALREGKEAWECESE
ncbi:MAG TPA: cation transporter [Acidimicrobiales bacterium]